MRLLGWLLGRGRGPKHEQARAAAAEEHVAATQLRAAVEEWRVRRELERAEDVGERRQHERRGA